MAKCPGRKFKLETAIKVGLQMFNRIRSLHKIGYVHRDIKLNNYVCSLPEEEGNKSSAIRRNKTKEIIANN